MSQRDHFSPQVYQRGFIAPDREHEQQPLSIFLVREARWRNNTCPKRVGYLKGYESARDPAFEHRLRRTLKASEDAWPGVLRQLRVRQHREWESALPSALEFAAWLSLRNPFFRVEDLSKHGGAAEGLEDLSIQEASLRRMVLGHPGRLQYFSSLNWSMRVSDSTLEPVITNDRPITLDNQSSIPASRDEARFAPEAVVVFPVAWDMLLLGSSSSWSRSLAPLAAPEFERLYQVIVSQAQDFVLSPRQVRLPIRA